MWRSRISRCINVIKRIFGLTKKAGQPSPVIYTVIHYVLVAMITLLLAYFSSSITAKKDVATGIWLIDRCYWGLVFLMFYAFVRGVLYMVSLFGGEEVSEFEDIDRAWAAGLDGLARQGIDLQWLPLFLVVGPTADEERRLFAAAGMKWIAVAPEPEDRSAVLRFYASDEAVFLCCPGIGAMARQRRLAPVQSGPTGATQQPAGQAGETLRRDVVEAARQATIAPPSPAAAAGGTLMPGGVGPTLPPPGDGEQRLQRPVEAAPPKLGNVEAAEERRRLEYLCRLVTAERRPFCPTNGLLTVLPLEWSRSSKMLELLPSPRKDVETIHRACEMYFPVVCLFSGLESFAGMAEFVRRGNELDRRFRNSRAGSRFPAGRAVDDEAAGWVVERSLQWFKGWIYSEFAKDLSNAENKKLYRLLCELDERRRRLERQLVLLFGETGLQVPPRLSGCYFCAAGSGTDQKAFLNDVLQKMIGEQDEVAWSEDRLRRDQRARVGAYGAMAAGLLLAVTDGILLWDLLDQTSGTGG